MKLRFSIRDLLWLTALCAVLVAWWIDHRRISAIAAKFKDEVGVKFESAGSRKLLPALLTSKDEQLKEALQKLEKLRSERAAEQADGGPK